MATKPHISINKLITLMNSISCDNVLITPISGFKIQNINMPDCYKKQHELQKTTLSEIRLIFNTLTYNNLDNSEINLTNVLHNSLPVEANNKKISNYNLLLQIIKEILELFLVDQKNVKMFYILLSKVANIAVGDDFKYSIKYIFLQECRLKFNNLTNELNIRHLASQDDSDDGRDIYTRGFDKISNLMLLFSELYIMRDKPVLNIGSNQMISIIIALFENYTESYKNCTSFLNKYDLDEIDDDLYNEYLILKKINIIYASHICYVFSLTISLFKNDKVEYKNTSLHNLIDRFKNEIVPTIKEKYLISKIKDIEW